MKKIFVENLEQTRFFRYMIDKGGLTPENLYQLRDYFHFRSVPTNSYLLQAGEICRYIFFVEEGLLINQTLNEKGQERIIHIAPENWILTDRSSLYFSEPSEFFIKSIEDSIVVYLHEDYNRHATELSSVYGCFVNDSLQRNIYTQEKRIQSLLSMTAKERYLSFLERYPDTTQRIPQWMIASYLGITPESLSRVRREIAGE